MNEHTYTRPIFTNQDSVDEVLNHYETDWTKHGNDLDALNISNLLLEAGHYRESMSYALRVQRTSFEQNEVPEDVGLHMARQAYAEACERARPLFEAAAMEIEGQIENSQTMAAYELGLTNLKRDYNL